MVILCTSTAYRNRAEQSIISNHFSVPAKLNNGNLWWMARNTNTGSVILFAVAATLANNNLFMLRPTQLLVWCGACAQPKQPFVHSSVFCCVLCCKPIATGCRRLRQRRRRWRHLCHLLARVRARTIRSLDSSTLVMNCKWKELDKERKSRENVCGIVGDVWATFIVYDVDLAVDWRHSTRGQGSRDVCAPPDLRNLYYSIPAFAVSFHFISFRNRTHAWAYGTCHIIEHAHGEQPKTDERKRIQWTQKILIRFIISATDCICFAFCFVHSRSVEDQRPMPSASTVRTWPEAQNRCRSYGCALRMNQNPKKREPKTINVLFSFFFISLFLFVCFRQSFVGLQWKQRRKW